MISLYELFLVAISNLKAIPRDKNLSVCQNKPIKKQRGKLFNPLFP